MAFIYWSLESILWSFLSSVTAHWIWIIIVHIESMVTCSCQCGVLRRPINIKTVIFWGPSDVPFFFALYKFNLCAPWCAIVHGELYGWFQPNRRANFYWLSGSITKRIFRRWRFGKWLSQMPYNSKFNLFCV